METGGNSAGSPKQGGTTRARLSQSREHGPRPKLTSARMKLAFASPFLKAFAPYSFWVHVRYPFYFFWGLVLGDRRNWRMFGLVGYQRICVKSGSPNSGAGLFCYSGKQTCGTNGGPSNSKVGLSKANLYHGG